MIMIICSKLTVDAIRTSWLSTLTKIFYLIHDRQMDTLTRKHNAPRLSYPIWVRTFFHRCSFLSMEKRLSMGSTIYMNWQLEIEAPVYLPLFYPWMRIDNEGNITLYFHLFTHDNNSFVHATRISPSELYALPCIVCVSHSSEQHDARFQPQLTKVVNIYFHVSCIPQVDFESKVITGTRTEILTENNYCETDVIVLY